jgi:tetratricopeptide (TPR) repeat protein
MRYLIYLSFLLTSCSTSGQEKSKTERQELIDDQIIEKYLKKGAWRLRYFSPEYQLYIDSAISIKPNLAYLYQQKAMPYFKQGKYELGLKSLDRAVELASSPEGIPFGTVFPKQYRNLFLTLILKTYQHLKILLSVWKLNDMSSKCPFLHKWYFLFHLFLGSIFLKDSSLTLNVSLATGL